MSEASRASFASASNICAAEGTCRRQAEALGRFLLVPFLYRHKEKELRWRAEPRRFYFLTVSTWIKKTRPQGCAPARHFTLLYTTKE